MKILITIILFSRVCLGQAFLIWPLLDQPPQIATAQDPRYRLLYPENLADTHKLAVWQYSGVDYYARDIEYPDSLDMFNQKHVVGINANTPWGNTVFALGVERIKETAAIFYKKDSLTIKSKIQNADTLVSYFISYKNRFFDNRIALSLSILPVVGLGSATIGTFDRLRIDNSFYASFSFSKNSDLFCFFCEHLDDVSSHCDILQLASQGMFFSPMVIGNQINFNYRTTTKTQTARAGANMQLRSGKELRLSYQEDRITPGSSYFLEDYALINGKDRIFNAQFDDSISPLFSYLINASYEECYYNIQAKYKRENGSYSSLIPQMKPAIQVEGLEIATDMHLSQQMISGLNVKYKKRSLSFSEYASMSTVKLTMISYGLQKFSAAMSAQQFSGGAHWEFRTITGNRFFASSEYTYQKIIGSVATFDTWTFYRDTIPTPLQGIHLINLEFSGKVKIYPRFFCNLFWNQTVPLHFDFISTELPSDGSGDGDGGNGGDGGGDNGNGSDGNGSGGSDDSNIGNNTITRAKQLFGLARISASISYEY